MTVGNTELAVLHADACGFSSVMAKSVDLAIAKLNAGQKLARNATNMFGGKVVDMTGDSMLLAFGSPQAAYCTARHMREVIQFRSQQNETNTPFELRIGIAKGKVTVNGRKMFGTCINLAARIESLVSKGGIGIEREAWNEVRNQANGMTVRSRQIFAKPEEPVVDFVEIMDSRSSSPLRMEGARNAPVIELEAMFGDKKDKNQNAAVDALIWNCTATFAAHDWVNSIRTDSAPHPHADGSAIDYAIRMRAIDLPMGFRLLASLSSPYLRQTTQHYSADFLELDDFSSRVASLSSCLTSAISHAETERVKDVRRIGSHQLVAAGRACLSGLSEEHFQTGLRYMQTALNLDREYPLLLSSLGRAYAFAWRFGWKAPGGDHMETALDYASAAAKLAPDDPRVQADLGFVKFWNKDLAEAAWHYDRSLDSLPFHPELAADAGMVFSYSSNNHKAAAVLERSIANLPNNPDYRLWSLGDVHFAERNYADALKWLSRMNDQSQAQRLLAASKARLGLDAKQHVERVLLHQPDFSVMRWVAIQPFANEAERLDYQEALLAAGLPK